MTRPKKYNIRKRRTYNKCQYCNKRIEYAPFQSVKNYNKIKFCSVKCYLASCQANVECLFCGKTIKTTYSHRKYCSRKCYFDHKKYKQTICSFCGIDLNGEKRFVFGKKFYCSHKCFLDDYGRDNVKYCYKCHKPLYSKSGNKKDYKYMLKHPDCSIFKDT